MLHRLREFLRPKPKKPVVYVPCPNCGADVKRGALACRACGSDAGTGWSETSETDATDLGRAVDDFDYEEYLEREFGGPKKPAKWSRNQWKRVGVTILTVTIIVLLILALR